MKASKGFVGYMVVGRGARHPCDDPIFAPYYDVSEAAKRPVLVLVGYNGAGAGHPGGGGMILDHCHPRFVDALAARRPNLTIIAGRPAWPWQDEMIAVLLHKPNVWYELHGWSPKYFTDALKRDISRRLKNRVMFGGDYPLFTYERLVSDWRSLGYDDDGARAGDAGQRRAAVRPGHGAHDWRSQARSRSSADRARASATPSRAAWPATAPTSRWWRAAPSRSKPPPPASATRPAGALSPSRRTSARLTDCERIIAEPLAHFGRLDILVNNDGAPPLGELMSFDDAAWDKAWQQNFMSVVRLTRGAVPAMRAAGGGRIVNITALSVLQPMPKFGLSVATWAGVIGYAKTLSLEVAADNITVNTICPGRIATGRLAKVFGPGGVGAVEQDEAIAAAAEGNPARPLRPAGRDRGVLSRCWCPTTGGYITGATLHVDGGRRANLL